MSRHLEVKCTLHMKQGQSIFARSASSLVIKYCPGTTVFHATCIRATLDYSKSIWKILQFLLVFLAAGFPELGLWSENGFAVVDFFCW